MQSAGLPQEYAQRTKGCRRGRQVSPPELACAPFPLVDPTCSSPLGPSQNWHGRINRLPMSPGLVFFGVSLDRTSLCQSGCTSVIESKPAESWISVLWCILGSHLSLPEWMHISD
eukprot:1161566-Pelagomonas_calceolata.AAC.4